MSSHRRDVGYYFKKESNPTHVQDFCDCNGAGTCKHGKEHQPLAREEEDR